MASVAKLLERVEAATGPDRELDAAILDAVWVWPERGPYAHWQAAFRAFGWDANITASLDAALALVERLLPGCGVMLNIGSFKSASVWPLNASSAEAESRTPPLALLAAMLKALSKDPT